MSKKRKRNNRDGVKLERSFPRTPGSRWRHFLHIFALAYVVFVMAMQFMLYPIGDSELDTDSYVDLVIATEKLADGHFSVQNYPYKGPLFSFVLQPVRLFVGDWYRAASVVNGIAAFFCIILGFRVLRRIFNESVAVLTCVVVVLGVDFFLQSHRTSTDILFLALVLASVDMLLARTNSWRFITASGAFAGLAMLTRYNGAFLPVAACLVLLGFDLERVRFGARLRRALIYLGAFFVVFGPWMWLSYRETGHALATKNLENFVRGVYEGSRWYAYPIKASGSLGEILREDGGRVVLNVLINLLHHVRDDFLYLLRFPAAILGGLGLLGCLLVPPRRDRWRFYVLALAYFLSMGIIFYSVRYFFLLAFAYVATGFWLFLGAADEAKPGWRKRLAQLVDVRGHPRNRFLFLGFLAVLLAFQVQRIYAAERDAYARRPMDLLTAARVLEAHAEKSGKSVLLARKGQLAYHAGLQYRMFPKQVDSVEQLLEFVRAEHIDYVAYGNIEFRWVPSLQALAVTDSLPGLRLLYEHGKARIFEVTTDEQTTTAQRPDREQLLRARLSVAQKKGDPYYIMRAHRDLGVFLFERGDRAAALDQLKKAVAMAERLPESERAATDLAIYRHNLALVLFSVGRAAEALPLALHNVEFFAEKGNPSTEAASHALAGRCYHALGNDPMAREENLRAVSLYREVGEIDKVKELEARLR